MSLFAKEQFPGMKVRPVGVKLLSDGTFLFVEFNDQTDINAVATRRYKRYELVRKT